MPRRLAGRPGLPARDRLVRARHASRRTPRAIRPEVRVRDHPDRPDRAADKARRSAGIGPGLSRGLELRQHARAYKSDWADFTAWCEGAGEIPLPATPIAVATYLAQLADRGIKASTIQRRLAAIRAAHLAAGAEPPTNAEGVKATMRGIRRSKGTRPNKKAPATAEWSSASCLTVFRTRYRDPRSRHGAAGIRRGVAPVRAC
jgi:hypothetical protein